ncbi:MAG: T9SS type A sorting domain-containing protein, partial [Ignavibacteria bacterium]|nr:T9SS type A sorting domain-containing protein [Ignavibacteria bacterium]
SDGGISFYDYTAGIEDETRNTIPESFSISQNYPNPFNPTSKIKYQIPELSFVTLKVYDVLGNEVATLVNEEKPTGTNEVEFNAEGLPSGIYFYQLKAGSFSETKKMILLK